MTIIKECKKGCRLRSGILPRWPTIPTIAAVALVLLPGAASAQFANGSFETGDYTGWTLLENSGVPSFGTWGIATNGQTINPGDSVFDYFDGINVTQFSPGLPHTYTATDGNIVALQLQNGPETHRMYQDIALPSGVTTIAWDMEYNNHNLIFDPTNQVLEVNVRNPVGDAILATLFSTTEGVDPQSIPMTSFSADVSAFAGQTVRISVDMIVNFFFFDAAFDNFRVPDSDGDGVLDGDDFCANTAIPEGVPTVILNPNHWALTDNDNVFDTVTAGKGKGPGRSYDAIDTAGCSCEQIIEAQGLGEGHTKYGCSISAMDDWVLFVNP